MLAGLINVILCSTYSTRHLKHFLLIICPCWHDSIMDLLQTYWLQIHDWISHSPTFQMCSIGLGSGDSEDYWTHVGFKKSVWDYFLSLCAIMLEAVSDTWNKKGTWTSFCLWRHLSSHWRGLFSTKTIDRVMGTIIEQKSCYYRTEEGYSI